MPACPHLYRFLGVSMSHYRANLPAQRMGKVFARHGRLESAACLLHLEHLRTWLCELTVNTLLKLTGACKACVTANEHRKLEE